MSLWYSNSSPRYKESGKFHQRARTGLTRSGSMEYNGWHYQITSHETGTSVKRTTFGVEISDPIQQRAEYLRGYSSFEQATTAAQEWIDVVVEKTKRRVPAAPLGTIPKLPNAAVNQEK